MKVGDFIVRKKFLDKSHLCGIIIDFDVDGDPIIYWNGDFIEEEFANQVGVISESI